MYMTRLGVCICRLFSVSFSVVAANIQTANDVRPGAVSAPWAPPTFVSARRRHTTRLSTRYISRTPIFQPSFVTFARLVRIKCDAFQVRDAPDSPMKIRVRCCRRCQQPRDCRSKGSPFLNPSSHSRPATRDINNNLSDESVCVK